MNERTQRFSYFIYLHKVPYVHHCSMFSYLLLFQGTTGQPGEKGREGEKGEPGEKGYSGPPGRPVSKTKS